MYSRRVIIILLSAIAITLVGAISFRSPESLLGKSELSAMDLVARNGRKTPPNPKLIFLAIDAPSISLEAQTDVKTLFGLDPSTPEAEALSQMSQQWPWPRSVYALILDRLVSAGAKAVVFDLHFPTPSDHDPAFRVALDRYADNVVIGSNFTTLVKKEGESIQAELTFPTPGLIAQTETPDRRVGFVNFWPDPDGVIRAANFRVSFGQFLGGETSRGESSYLSLAARAVEKLGRGDLVPADHGSRNFRYTEAPQKGFVPHSIFEIFVPEYWKRNYQSGAAFAGAVVVVGAAGNWQHDEHQTPVGIMSGPEIQLNVVNAVLQQEFLTPVSFLWWGAIYLGAGALGAALHFLIARPLWRTLWIGIISGLWFAAQFILFNYVGVQAPFVGPTAVFILTGFAGVGLDLLRAGAEQFRLRATLEERERSQKLLQAANEELEGRVAERTVELTRANHLLTGSLAEKEVLLKEVHHRVKNNLQVISSLLNLQSEHIKDPLALQAFTESRSRVRSMALIHEKLYQSPDLARIDFNDYLAALSSGLKSTFSGKSTRIQLSLDVDKIMLPVDSAVPCGLIINELVSNCYKYAFTHTDTGEIWIRMKRSAPKELQLSVSDNGIGFPKDVDFRNTESLGMQLVTSLAEQLDGKLTMRNGCGTTFEIAFPETD